MIKFTWEIGFYCNFKCNYCFYSQARWENLEKIQGPPKSPEIVKDAWKDIYNKYGPAYVYITGGEPFLYPNFVEIISRISKFHKIHVTTNLSLSIDEFICKIFPKRGEINATLHPPFVDIKKFISQILKLKKANFTCNNCYLAHSMQMREMLNYKKYFKKFEIDMALNIFWGKYKGKKYPQDYSEKEKKYYQFVANWTRNKEKIDNKFFSKGEEFKEKDPQLYNLCPSISTGRLCNAGYKYAIINVDGTVKPCGQVLGPILGNIYQRNIRLYERPMKCRIKYCKCREFEYGKE